MTASLYQIGDWRVEPDANRLCRNDVQTEIEPQVMDLLMLFVGRPGEVLPKAEIAEAVWGEVSVNDDALTRTLWKLRQALGDDAKSPTFIETVPKRGYRLIADVSKIKEDADHPASPSRPPFELLAIGGVLLLGIVLLVALPALRGETDPQTDIGRETMLQRADAFYAQYTRSENEAALRLYETVLASHPGDAAALAGLSNAIVQRVLRFTGPGGTVADRRSLTEALESGWLDHPEARPALERAEALARQATEADPSHARAWRAYGLALSTRRQFEAAEAAYNRALVIQPDDWGSLINLSDIAQITGQTDRSTAYLAQAYDAMTRRFAEDAVLVRPWQSQVGLTVAERKLRRATRRRPSFGIAGCSPAIR
jgi:transcriptional activator of cad operon